ncbi:MAG TPA: alkyl sulfatase dimerization domain-containing protein [Candidatus Sulfotelmatobacter sp.]|nr:alkyl sulfatase dimerization domain-containing protein [Candidatus Sulfotelmatobacter sp.]
MSRMGALVFGLTVAIAAAQDQPKLVKINDAISMAPMTSNVYLVTTTEGSVVIDTAPARDAAEAKELLSTVHHGPVKYIVLTHGHADHIGGIDLWKETGTQVIAQRNYAELVNYVARLEGFFAPRNAAAFGRPAHEVGPWAGNYGGKIDPTIFFDDKYDFTLGGIEFQLFSTPGETPDHLTVWIPAYKAAFIGDNYAGAGMPEPMSFPNLYAIRGTKPRWALDWIKSIDTVLALKPEIVLNGHGDPIFGNQEITRRLKRYRDAIQYVHDETVKGMNAGKDAFTLMKEIKLPASYDLSQIFGKVSWSVRGIYDGYAGWFDGNPTSMYVVPASSVYPDLVKLAGGPEPIVRLALQKLDDKEPVEALHLTDVVLAADPKNKSALAARIKALEYLRDRCENAVEDGWLQYGIRKAKENLSSQ